MSAKSKGFDADAWMKEIGELAIKNIAEGLADERAGGHGRAAALAKKPRPTPIGKPVDEAKLKALQAKGDKPDDADEDEDEDEDDDKS